MVVNDACRGTNHDSGGDKAHNFGRDIHVAGEKIAANLSCHDVQFSPDVAKLSVSGVGLRSHTGVAIRMFKALADAGINVDMINTSEVRVNVVVEGRSGEKGLNALQQAFSDALR